jgi:flavin reductase (DIM6/NTAB) family NADH-FMN oxidoreductase RutF
VPIPGELYKQIGRAAAGAVSIVTARSRDSDAVVGLTVSSFVTLSFDPPLVMFAIQHAADCYPSILASEFFGVSLLGAQQSQIARRFARKGGTHPSGRAPALFRGTVRLVRADRRGLSASRATGIGFPAS